MSGMCPPICPRARGSGGRRRARRNGRRPRWQHMARCLARRRAASRPPLPPSARCGCRPWRLVVVGRGWRERVLWAERGGVMGAAALLARDSRMVGRVGGRMCGMRLAAAKIGGRARGTRHGATRSRKSAAAASPGGENAAVEDAPHLPVPSSPHLQRGAVGGRRAASRARRMDGAAHEEQGEREQQRIQAGGRPLHPEKVR